MVAATYVYVHVLQYHGTYVYTYVHVYTRVHPLCARVPARITMGGIHVYLRACSTVSMLLAKLLLHVLLLVCCTWFVGWCVHVGFGFAFWLVGWMGLHYLVVGGT